MCDDRYILDGKSFVDTKTNQCLNFGVKDLARVTITLNNMDMWLNQAEEQIAELEEQLKNAIRFKTPQIERFAVVQYIHQNKKPYKIVNCFDAYKDENMKTKYCFYGVPSTNFKVIQICDTKEEAEAKLRELKGEKR